MNKFQLSCFIYIEKPQVLSDKIFGSLISKISENEYKRVIIFKNQKVSDLEENIYFKSHEISFYSCIGSYTVIHKSDENSVNVTSDKLKCHKVINVNFLNQILMKKINNWMSQEVEYKPPSLRLVDIKLYRDTYYNLKEKYSNDLVKNWEEKTDAEKFVHEDIAISSYLICIWHKTKDRTPKFVDIGCGNGLLVYLLNKEGFDGIGVDLRAREIWSKYPSEIQANLKVQTVTPDSRFPGYNWLIGNHSDELTPWIPVIAVRSVLDNSNNSIPADCFLLPCCSFDFYGKFIKTFSASGAISNSTITNVDTGATHNSSKYNCYKAFIQQVLMVCGYSVETDSLRIPSTKRFCLIGSFHENSDESNVSSLITSISNFIQSRPQTDLVGQSFRARDSEIRVRNCDTVSDNVKTQVYKTVLQSILEKQDDWLTIGLSNENKGAWNKGGRVKLGELIGQMNQEWLVEMKRENGGLQTLLRNMHQVFKVIGGHVELRFDGKFEESQTSEPMRKRRKNVPAHKSKPRKVKPCWLEMNHPQGCPIGVEQCGYLHQCEIRGDSIGETVI